MSVTATANPRASAETYRRDRSTCEQHSQWRKQLKDAYPPEQIITVIAVVVALISTVIDVLLALVDTGGLFVTKLVVTITAHLVVYFCAYVVGMLLFKKLR